MIRNPQKIIEVLRKDPAQRVFYVRNVGQRGWWLASINKECAPCPYTPDNHAISVNSDTILKMIGDKIL